MKTYFKFLPTALVLAACGGQVNAPQGNLSELNAVEKRIDPSIQGPDRILLKQAMLLVPENQRESFTLITEDGRAISNKGLKAASVVQVLHPVQVAGSLYKYIETGQTFVLPDSIPVTAQSLREQSVVCSDGANTGGFYRSMSKPGTGTAGNQLHYWTAAQSDVILPTSINIKYNPTTHVQTETPYVLLGGWGADNLNNGVDAGLQANLKYANGQISYEWQIFLKVGATLAPSSSAVRFGNGQDVLLNLVVAPATTTATTSTAYLSASSGGQSVSVQLAAPGWTTTGATNVMKRLTGIAQNSTAQNGSSLGTTTWQNIKIGGYKNITPPFFTTNLVDWNGNGRYQCFNPNAFDVTLSDISIWDYFEDVSIAMQ